MTANVVTIYRKHDALIVSPPELAVEIAVGARSMLARTSPLDMAGRDLVLVSQRWALGVLRLGPMRRVRTVAALKRLSQRHGMTEPRRRRLSRRQPKWRSPPFYCWSILRFTPFESPRVTDVPVGRQGLVVGAKVYGA